MGGKWGGGRLEKGVEGLTQGEGRCIGGVVRLQVSGHLFPLPVGRRRALIRAGLHTAAIRLPTPVTGSSLLLIAIILGSRGTLLGRSLAGWGAAGLAAAGGLALGAAVIPLHFLTRVPAGSRIQRALSRLCRALTNFPRSFRVPIVPYSTLVW